MCLLCHQAESRNSAHALHIYNPDHCAKDVSLHFGFAMKCYIRMVNCTCPETVKRKFKRKQRKILAIAVVPGQKPPWLFKPRKRTVELAT